MSNAEEIKLEKCHLKVAPNYLPKVLKERVQNIINSFEYAKTNPRYYYYKTISPHEFIRRGSDKKMTDKEWFNHIRHLNRSNNALPLVIDSKMKDVWLKLEKLNTDEDSLIKIFRFCSNKYNDIIGYQKIEVDFWEGIGGRSAEKHAEEYIKIRNDPSKLLNLLAEAHSILIKHSSLIAPDGADCFEYLDVDDPENKIYLDDNGNLPYKMNWDLYIKDDEYFQFKETLEKIIQKLINRIKLNEEEKTKNLKYLENPKSRKQNVENAKEIEFAKELYIKFMQEFKKPCYKEISIILDVLFNSIYTENDIVKITKKPRDKIKSLKKTIQKDGISNYYNDSRLIKALFENKK